MALYNTSEGRNRKKAGMLSRTTHRKYVVLLIIVLAVLVGLSLNLGRISASSGEKYAKKVLNSRGFSSKTIPYRRGTIQDIKGETLAVSEKVYYVILDCKVLNQCKEDIQDETILELVSCFGDMGITEDLIRGYLRDKPDSAYIRILSEVPFEKTAVFIEKKNQKDSKITGVWFEDSFKRQYPQGSLTSHVVGFTLNSEVGQWGIEASYDDELTGSNGRTYGYLNVDDYVETATKAAEDGNNLVLSIDAGAQAIIQKHVVAFNKAHENEARTGLGTLDTSVLVMNPNTGAVMAMYNYPEFDPNNPNDLTVDGLFDQAHVDAMSDDDKKNELSKMWTNYCISKTYEPGSVVKAFTVATGLECGKLNGTESFKCDGGEEFKDAGYYVKCNNVSGHGIVSLSQAISLSCNDALMQIARKIGVDDFTKYQQVFGVGKKTNIDLPGEVNADGLFFRREDMKEIDLATNSFGQTYNVTMIQTAAAFCSLINGGKYYQPYVVQRVENSKGDVIKNHAPVLIKETISSDTCQKLKGYMRETMVSGTGKHANIEGYEIGAKTGTAEKLPREDGNYLLSFMGFAPASNPEVLVYIVIDQPNVGKQDNGFLTAGLAKDIMTELFPYLEITRSDNSETENNEAIWEYKE